jgi:hypothetical protein
MLSSTDEQNNERAEEFDFTDPLYEVWFFDIMGEIL